MLNFVFYFHPHIRFVVITLSYRTGYSVYFSYLCIAMKNELGKWLMDSKVYHDRSRTDIRFRRILPKMDNRGLYLLKDNNDNKKRIR